MRCWCFLYAEFTTAVKPSDTTRISGLHADHRGKIITVITKSSNFHSVFRDLLSLENIQAYIPQSGLVFLGLQTTDMNIHLPLYTAEDTASTGLPARDMEQKKEKQEETCSAPPGKTPVLKNSPESELRGWLKRDSINIQQMKLVIFILFCVL